MNEVLFDFTHLGIHATDGGHGPLGGSCHSGVLVNPKFNASGQTGKVFFLLVRSVLEDLVVSDIKFTGLCMCQIVPEHCVDGL